MEKRRRAPGHAAPYGQSCTNCFKSKCKCILRSDGDSCERCHRLKKPCHPGDSIRRTAADNTQRANARIADLEGKLSSLVSLLQDRNVIDKDAEAESDTRIGYGGPELGDAGESDGPGNDDDRDMNIDEQDDGPQYDATVLSPPLTGSPSSQLAPTPLTAVSGPSIGATAEDFQRFRSLMLPNFPFICFRSEKCGWASLEHSDPYFGEMEPLRWTSQMDQGLAALQAHQEFPSDKAFTFQVRLQLLATRCAQLDLQPIQSSITGLPSTAVLDGQMFLTQLQEIRASLDLESLPKQGALLAHTHYTELRILDAGSQIRPHEPPKICPGPTADMTALPSDSVFCLWKAELAVNACAKVLLSLPASDFLGASFIQSIQWSHLANCIAILCQLAKAYHDPGADPAVGRAIGELPGVLDRLADRLNLAAVEAGEDRADGVLTQLAGGMRKFRSSIDVEKDSSGGESGSGAATSTVPFQNPGAWLGHIWDDLSS
ncbi:C6 transcription factor [Colletotrichum kahawae]|uniref:C6 transcription factor n=1 Tax=Colletotrichum kahawae TaxID=34407 RepID=A0AAE0DF38_COLKA|nr:C6 transcription factor [Colletotrichum kahawae]